MGDAADDVTGSGAPEPTAPRAESLLDDGYDDAPCGYLITRPDGTIVTVNRTLLRWTGHHAEDLLGRRFRDLLTVGGRIYHETHYAPLLRMQGEVREIALDLVCADRRRLPVLVNAVLRHDAAGRPELIRTTVFDATDRRHYERELLLARRAAEAAANRLRVLQQIVARLAAALTTRNVAEVIVQAPRDAFGTGDGAVWLVDDGRLVLTAGSAGAATGSVRATADAGRAAVEQPLTDRAGPAAPAVVLDRRDVLVLGPDRPAGAAERWLTGVDPGRTLVLTPLAADGVVLGVLAFTHPEPDSVAGPDLDMLRLLGQQAGQALDRARLYDETRRREDRAAFLAGVTRAMDEVRSRGQRAERLVQRLVPEFADGAVLRLAASRATDPLAQAGVATPVGEAAWLSTLVGEAVAGAPPRLAGAPGGTDGDRWAVLPLPARGVVAGTLTLRFAADRRVAPATLAFLAELADRAGLSLENARLYEQEREIARTLQRSLLAGEPPRDPRFTVTSHYQPASDDLEVGGDWHDAFMLTTDRLCVVVGDVVGRGIKAASAMGQLRSAIRALSAGELGPARLIERLDRFVTGIDSARMATLAYAEIALSTGQMTFSCAGHPPPLLLVPGSDPTYLWGGRSAPLGSRAGRRARVEEQVTLPAGARLLLYTDGLVERRDQPLDVGFAQLAGEMANRRTAPLTGLAGQLAGALTAVDHRDDVCLLCLSFGAEPALERSIPADAAQLAALRRELRGWLAVHEVDEESRDALLLACSEAVANAIEHGYRDDPGGMIAVAARRTGDAIELSVRDRGKWRPARTEPARGRGLYLIKQLMDDVRVQRGPGTTVTMRRQIAGEAA